MKDKKRIVLVGMMGVGKTTLGRMLSKHLGYEFIDIDDLITTIEGKSIPDIFKNHGEAYFRDVEADTIEEVLSRELTVVSTGGGAMTTPSTADLICDNSVSIWIHSEPQTLLKRIEGDSGRPLMQTDNPLETLKKLEKDRISVYKRASIHIKSGDEPLDTTFKKILKELDAL